MDNKLLDNLNNLNITQLNLSMASLDNDQLKDAKRSGDRKKLEAIIEYSSRLKIPVITYFICGLKGDSPLKTVETIKYLHTQNTSIGISLYYPVPGLKDWSNKNLFIDNPPSLCLGSSAWPWNRSMSTKELITAFRLARTSNYIKTINMDKNQIDKLKINLLDDSTLDKRMVELFFNNINLQAVPKTT